ncbi:serine/threonine-protein kinase, partial [Mangrovicoccus algicola]
MTGAAPAAGDIFRPGDLLNNTYRIEALLGRGGVSEVYRARSEISGRVMAVKALRAEYARDEDFLSLMTREEEVREIRHDAVVRYFDAQRMADGVIYLVMDYIEGPGMDARLAAGGMTASELMIAGARICDGLAAAHARNIVHRDLSPDNIILRDGRPDQAVIIDFGIAKDANPGAATIVGDGFAGKFSYAAPEQLAGRSDARSDIYALGALLLAVYRGARPDPGRNPMEVLERKRAPLDLSGVPRPLRTILSRMTAPAPQDRYQSAAEAAAAFRAPPSAADMAAPEAEATLFAPAAAPRAVPAGRGRAG